MGELVKTVANRLAEMCRTEAPYPVEHSGKIRLIIKSDRAGHILDRPVEFFQQGLGFLTNKGSVTHPSNKGSEPFYVANKGSK